MSGKSPENRIYFIDNIRTTMIILVIMLHTSVTYSGIGGWYYRENFPEKLDTFSLIVFAIFNSFTQGFFMGLLFFIAGYFVPSAYIKKGMKKFIIDRFQRLMIPTIFYMIFMTPLVAWIAEYRENIGLIELYKKYYSEGIIFSGSGPLWFALALFIFSVIYAIVMKLRKNTIKSKNTELKLSNNKIIILISIIATGSYFVRLFMPIDTSFYNMQLCFFTQYIVLFSVGIISSKYDFIKKVQYNYGLKWGFTGLTIGLIIWILMMVFGGALAGKFDLYKGGTTWQSLVYAIWESFFCVSFCIGIIVTFREKLNVRNKLTVFLSDNSFSVYVFHSIILVSLSVLTKNIYLYPLIKAVIVAIIVIPLSFVTAFIMRKLTFFLNYF
ncbi:MAG: acyltransferase [Fusobacteriaceae bacterium]|nr:acyltransferase [Fusobacteriaceae bacterium]